MAYYNQILVLYIKFHKYDLFKMRTLTSSRLKNNGQLHKLLLCVIDCMQLFVDYDCDYFFLNINHLIIATSCISNGKKIFILKQKKVKKFIF